MAQRVHDSIDRRAKRIAEKAQARVSAPSAWAPLESFTNQRRTTPHWLPRFPALARRSLAAVTAMVLRLRQNVDWRRETLRLAAACGTANCLSDVLVKHAPRTSND